MVQPSAVLNSHVYMRDAARLGGRRHLTTSERSRSRRSCRFTVSSAVSTVGPDLVVSSVARARAVCVAHRLAIVFVVPTHPGDVSFRRLVSRSLGGVGHASCAHVCAAERPPMLCETNHLISHYPSMIHDNVTSATGYGHGPRNSCESRHLVLTPCTAWLCCRKHDDS